MSDTKNAREPKTLESIDKDVNEIDVAELDSATGGIGRYPFPWRPIVDWFFGRNPRC